MIGLIYKIIHNQSNWCYVGSTFNELRYRWQDHKLAFLKWKDDRTQNKTSCFDYFLEYGIDNFKIILIKQYEVIDRLHLEVYETLWISKLKSCNRQSPFRIKKLSDLHYRNTHKEEIKIRDKKYRDNNIEKIKEKKQSYRLQHRAELNQKQKDRYIKRKEYILEKINCEICNLQIGRISMKRHIKRQHCEK